jgi:hypothetical protein
MLRVLEPVPRVLEPVPCVCHIHVQLETAAFVPKRVPWAPISFHVAWVLRDRPRLC